MSKKKAAGGRNFPQPRIYKEIGVERAREIMGFELAVMYLNDSRLPHPNDSDSEITAITGQDYMAEATASADMSIRPNRMRWRGGERETALEFALQEWKNNPHRRTRKNPKMFEADTEMMKRQRQWGRDQFG